MVVEWGMGERTGLMHLGSENSYFFGKDYMERVTYSEHYANIIDEEVKNILDKCESEAERLIKENRSKLETMAEVLLKRETIYSNEVDMIMNGESAESVIAKIDATTKKVEHVEANEDDNIVDGLQTNIIKTQPKNGDGKLKDNIAEHNVLKSDEISENISEAIEKTKKDTRKKK